MKKIDKKIIIIIILLVILIGIVIAYCIDSSGISNSNQLEKTSLSEYSEGTSTESAAKTTISVTGEIDSALEEQIELHATYYFEEIYVQENQSVKEGEKLVKYTNGTYLQAPYDCIITQISVPDEKDQCTNQHSITIKSINSLKITINVDEENISKVYVGQEANIYVESLDKNYNGYVTKVGSTASNGKFSIIVECVNDGNIKIGMTGKCTIIL